MGDISSYPFVDQCSTSSYGRVSNINDGDSARNAGPLHINLILGRRYTRTELALKK